MSDKAVYNTALSQIDKIKKNPQQYPVVWNVVWFGRSSPF